MKIVSKVWNKKQEISPIFFILTSAIILISLRWLIIYLFNPSEPLVNKIFFDLNDPIYFAYILNLSDLNFKPDYLINYIPDKIIALPIYSLIIHSITYAFFNEYSFIIVEYLSFFLFIYIFTKIFNELNISTYFSLILSLSIFLLPEFLVYFKHLKINLINFQILNSLYSFQIPRPVISSIYFFWGLLLAIYYHKYQNKNYLFILIGFNLALNFGSVYYNFVILSVLFFILFLNKVLKNNKFFLLYSLKNIFITLVTFFIFALPFIILLFFSEKDWLIRAGTFDPSFYQKKILISYFILKLLSVKFLLFFFVNTFFLFFLLKKQKIFCKKTIVVIYTFFISSFVAPILFILFSPTLSELYHFVDLIVAIGILLLFIFIILILATILKKNIKTYKLFDFILKNNFTFLLVILFISIIYNLNYFSNYKKNNNSDLRKDTNILYNYLNQNKNDQQLNTILTFDSKIQVWWMLLGEKKFSTIHSIFTPLKTFKHELNFIDALNFLNVSKKNFNNIIANKKEGWRYNNKYLRYFSSYKYQANSLITYNNSKNFKNEVLKFIQNSSPLFAQQIALPGEEVIRIGNHFNDTNNRIFEKPDIIILEKNSLITKYSSIDLNYYCKIRNLNYLDVYLSLKEANCDLEN